MGTSKKITAGDTLTVGDLTDDYLGAVIEVEMSDEVTTRLRLGRVTPRGRSTDVGNQKTIWACDEYPVKTWLSAPVTIVTPPPVVQPDEPKIFGQFIRIEGMPDWLGVVVDTQDGHWTIMDSSGDWWYWDLVLTCAGERQIIVSDPPRWPDETPEAPEHATIWEVPKAGDTFDRLEDMPFGWIAKVTLASGAPWGHVVRYDDDWTTHLWDANAGYGDATTGLWQECGEGTRSGGVTEGTRYTLVETSREYNGRVASEAVSGPLAEVK